MNKIGALSALATRHGSDKWGGHSGFGDRRYTEHYETHFAKFRDEEFNLLEIGIGGYDNPMEGGSSLKMWRDYFTQATIYGLDYYDKSQLAGERIKIFQGSQNDSEILQSMNKQSDGFTIIIDDGSHRSSDIIATFEILFPLLEMGGIYAVEDTQTSYWPILGGTSENLDSVKTTMGYFKALADGLNHVELVKPHYKPTYFDTHIASLHFYHNMIFIYKGDNTEKSNILKDNQLPPELMMDRDK
jgi:hypothetical protein